MRRPPIYVNVYQDIQGQKMKLHVFTAISWIGFYGGKVLVAAPNHKDKV